MSVSTNDLFSAVVRLRTALVACKERFDEYEKHHRAKPDHAKADRNKEMSELCRKALES